MELGSFVDPSSNETLMKSKLPLAGPDGGPHGLFLIRRGGLGQPVRRDERGGGGLVIPDIDAEKHLQAGLVGWLPRADPLPEFPKAKRVGDIGHAGRERC